MRPELSTLTVRRLAGWAYYARQGQLWCVAAASATQRPAAAGPPYPRWQHCCSLLELPMAAPVSRSQSRILYRAGQGAMRVAVFEPPGDRAVQAQKVGDKIQSLPVVGRSASWPWRWALERTNGSSCVARSGCAHGVRQRCALPLRGAGLAAGGAGGVRKPPPSSASLPSVAHGGLRFCPEPPAPLRLLSGGPPSSPLWPPGPSLPVCLPNTSPAPAMSTAMPRC